MNSKGTLTANVCLTTTALFAGTAWTQASASHSHKIKHGDTVELLSRRTHVPVRDILAANHIGADDVLHEGRTLVIPAARKAHTAPHTMRRAARVKGDRVSLRLGPDSTHHRVALCAEGAALTVTARRDGWLQVRTTDGRTGWVRSDFVHFSKGASAPPNAHASAANRHDKAVALARHERRAQQAAAAHHRQHLENVAHARKLAHQHEQAVLRRRREQVAHAGAHGSHHVAHRLSEHQNEALANYLHRQRIKLARMHHHNAHLAAIAHAAQHHKHGAGHQVVHRLSEHRNEALANYLHRQQLKMARLHRHGAHVAAAHAGAHHGNSGPHGAVVHRRSEHQNEALANYLRRQQIKMARLRHHGEHLSAIASAGHHRLSHHRNEALANYLRRQQAKMERRHRHGEFASMRRSGTHYSHHIRPEAESPSAANDVVRSAFA
ncbi:MAG TPA: SH3 domain-containing protein, partial [Chthonomonadaceae bacterium]|nr:SH3 domain-containing protein [Chthonomonadaceae bacterium]